MVVVGVKEKRQSHLVHGANDGSLLPYVSGSDAQFDARDESHSVKEGGGLGVLPGPTGVPLDVDGATRLCVSTASRNNTL